MAERVLHAFIEGTRVGTLRESSGSWAFRYHADWLQSPAAFPLSPSLPLQGGEQLDGATLRPVQWYFDNLLPEEGQRDLLAAEAALPAADAFGLLGWYGAESAGSLTLLAEDVHPGAAPSPPAVYRELPDAELAARIAALPRQSLSSGAAKRMSLAGAQHKLPVALRSGQLFEPAGAAPSTHILKPDHPRADYPHSVVNEWFVMTLAARVGLPVPRTERRYLPQPVYLVERFDRADGRRLHAIDACQLLGVDRSFKYLQGSVDTLARLANQCRSTAIARTRLFEWLAFNLLVGNSDAHLKNLSFLVTPQGIQLAPFYDLLAGGLYESAVFNQRGWPQQTALAWPLPAARRFADLTRAGLIEAGRAMGLAAATATRVLDALLHRVPARSVELLAEAAVDNTRRLAIEPALATVFGGEMRCLRAIHHAVIMEMVQRLAR